MQNEICSRQQAVYRALPDSLLSGYFQLKKKKKKDPTMTLGWKIEKLFSLESQGFLGLEEPASEKVYPQRPL